MPARVQLIVEAKDASSGVLRAIGQQFGALGNVIEGFTSKNIAWGDIATQVTGLVIDGLKDSYKAAQEYSHAVRDLALVSGTGAEESSRLLQVLDDFQISAEDVTAATRVMTKNGLVPTVDTLAQLSDQYLAITDAQERNEFVIKNLGRAGLQWVNVLNQGGDALRANSEAVNQNLILTDKQVHDLELARLAQDNWNDSIQGAKVAVGAWIGTQVAANDEHQKAIALLRESGVQLGRGVENTQAYRDALEQVRASEDLQTAAVENNTKAVAENTINYQSLIGSIQGAQKAIDDYKDKSTELAKKEGELSIKYQETIDDLIKTENAYGQNSSAAQKLRDKLNGITSEMTENQAAVRANEEEYKRWAAQTVYAFATARASADGNISAIEGEVLIDAGVALGLFDQKTATAMQNVNKSFDSLNTENAQEVIGNLKEQLDALVAQPYVVTISTVTTGNFPNQGNQTPHQIGGQVYAGSMSMVGEGGAEPFIPSQNGRILSHAESLHALTAGAGGNTNYFYGTVTLQLGEGEGDGLIGAR